MRIINFIVFILLFALCASAKTPAGLWKTIDDETGKEKSLVMITDNGGVVSGRIEKLLDPAKKGAVCDKCKDDKKGRPIEGMTIIENMSKTSDDTWEKGTILDPSKGKIYKARIRVIEGGKRLELRGYLGPFYRTQTWIKAD